MSEPTTIEKMNAAGLALEYDLAAMQRRAEAAEKRERETRELYQHVSSSHDERRQLLIRANQVRNKLDDDHARDIEVLQKQLAAMTAANHALGERVRKAEAVALAKTEETKTWPFFNQDEKDKLEQQIASLTLLLRNYGHDATGINPVTKAEQERTTKPDYTEAQLEACERENDRLRRVIDGISNLLPLSE